MKGYVYLICDNVNNLYKIGMTKTDIEKRIKSLQTGNATELFITTYHETEYPSRVESMLHNHFSSKRVLSEWFSLNEEDVINFNNICQKMENIISVLKDNPFFKKNLR